MNLHHVRVIQELKSPYMPKQLHYCMHKENLILIDIINHIMGRWESS